MAVSLLLKCSKHYQNGRWLFQKTVADAVDWPPLVANKSMHLPKGQATQNKAVFVKSKHLLTLGLQIGTQVHLLDTCLKIRHNYCASA